MKALVAKLDWLRVFISLWIILGILCSPIVEKIMVVALYLDWLFSNPKPKRNFFFKE